MTRLNIIFMTSSAQDLDQLNPKDLPKIPSAIDVWILRDQDILLISYWDAEDQVINMNFSGFQKQIKKVFSQTLMTKEQPFNQGLVIIDQTFQFIKIALLGIEANATFDLKRVNFLSDH